LIDLIKDEKPVNRGLPTLPEFKIRGTGDVASERDKWIALIEEHANCSNPDFVHPFLENDKRTIGYLKILISIFGNVVVNFFFLCFLYLFHISIHCCAAKI
jgi:hypothetical protein